MNNLGKRIKELISENDYLRTIINSANEGIYVTDRERQFIIWNDAAERITGFCRDNVIGNQCYNNILDHTNENGIHLCQNGCPLEKAMETKSPQGPDTVYLRHRDGRRVPVEVRTAPLLDRGGSVIGSVEVFQDITERRERERALNEKKRKLETVMDNICDGVLFIDHEGRISLFNRALADMMCIEKDLIAVKISSLPADNPLKRAIFRVEEGFGGPYCWEVFRCTEDKDCPERGEPNGRCWLRHSCCSLYPNQSCYECHVYLAMKSFLEQPKELVAGNEVMSVLSSFIEFREKKEIWEVIVFKEVTSEKLEAVMSLAGSAAHELRQPLQIIIGFLSLLKDRLGDSEMIVKYSDAIEESCVRMDNIIKKLCNVRQYKVKNYAGDLRILDLAQSSEKKGDETDS